jgi:hypothetical protein
MKQDSYSIEFDIQLEKTPVFLHLTAQVELHHSTPYYLVSEFRTANQKEGSVLPSLKIRKKQGKWVHLDTGKPTNLSEVVGKAIDDLHARTLAAG